MLFAAGQGARSGCGHSEYGVPRTKGENKKQHLEQTNNIINYMYAKNTVM